MMVRRQVFEQIGLLNSNYFAYWEETDFCLRAKDKGIKIIAVPSAWIWHKISASTTSSFKNFYYYRNRIWFVKEHGKSLDQTRFCMRFLLATFWLELWSTLIHSRDRKNMTSYLKGTFWGFLSDERTRAMNQQSDIIASKSKNPDENAAEPV